MKLLIDENKVIKAWQKVGGGWGDTEYTTVEVDDIPDHVTEIPEKYCYVDGEYVENPDYIEPVEPNETESLTLNDVALAVAELAETAASDKLEIEMAIAELAEVMTNG